MFARAGVIGIFTKRQINKKQTYLEKYLDTVQQERAKELVYKSNPFMIWLFGTMCTGFGVFLLIHILFYVPDTLFSGFKNGTWWQYMASLAVLVLGIAFFVEADRITVYLNRKKDIVSVTKTNVCLRRKVETRRASDCLKARIVKKGFDNVSSHTIHYNLMLDFEDDKPLKIADTTSRAQIKKRYVQVTDYLDLETKVRDVPIDDQTVKKLARDKKVAEQEAKDKKNEDKNQDQDQEIEKEKFYQNNDDNYNL